MKQLRIVSFHILKKLSGSGIKPEKHGRSFVYQYQLCTDFIEKQADQF